MTLIGNLVTKFTVEGMDGVQNAVAQYGKELTAAEKEAKDFNKGLDSILTTIANVTAGIAIGVAVIQQFTSKAAEFGAAVKDISYETGMNTDQVQRWQAAAVSTNVEFARLTQTMRMMSQRLMDADVEGSAMADALDKIGVSARDARGNLKDIDTIMKELITGLNKIPEGAERNALAMDIFGRSWADIAPMISQANAALDAYDQKSPFSEDRIMKMDAAKQKIGEIGDKFNIIAVQLGERFIPLLEVVAGRVDKIASNFDKVNTAMGDIGWTIEGGFGNMWAWLNNPYGGGTQYTDMRNTIERNKVVQDNNARSKAVSPATGTAEPKTNTLRKSLDEEIQINLYAIQDYITSIETKKQLNEDYAEDAKELTKTVADTEVKINASKNQALKDMWKGLKTTIEDNPVQAFIDIQAGLTIQKGGGDTGGIPSTGSKGWSLGGSTWDGVGVGSTGSEMWIFMKSLYEAGYSYQDALQYWGTSETPPGVTIGTGGIKARAGGGPVFAGEQYLVGENGPEIFNPGQNGVILPNGMGSGICNITVELDGEIIAQKIAAPLVGEIRVRTGVRF